MAVPVSSLSVAVQGIADFLDMHFGEDVEITTDTPQRAAERAKGSDKHILNLFTYRVAPSGFHAANTSEEPCFIRINSLLTAFPTHQAGTELDADLRILGHGIRVLASRPVLPLLPGGSADPLDFRNGPHLDYRLQAVLQAPGMEELNHIWTTQGGDLPYRLSAVYEFALIPVEPLEHATPPAPVRTAILDTRPEAPGDLEGLVELGAEARALPLAAGGTDTLAPSPTEVLPVVLFAADGLSSTATVAAATATVALAMSGLPGSRVSVRVDWTRADTTEESQPEQGFVVATPRIDDPAAQVVLALDAPAAGDRATIVTRAADDGGTVLPDSPLANLLTLTVEAAP